MIHGDDWKTGYMKEFRKNCLKVLDLMVENSLK